MMSILSTSVFAVMMNLGAKMPVSNGDSNLPVTPISNMTTASNQKNPKEYKFHANHRQKTVKHYVS